MKQIASRACSSETSLDFQRTTRLYIPEDGTLHNHQKPVWSRQEAELVPPKHRFIFNGLHGVISQKTELFISTISQYGAGSQ
jgi:hypothetical protein